jgi:hypothetical protein
MTSNPYSSVRVGFETERTVVAPFTGVNQNLGSPIDVTPVIAIFDNLSSSDVALFANNIMWKTVPAGEAFVLDLRANHGIASIWTIDTGTQFSIVGAAGTGQFSLAILYAR